MNAGTVGFLLRAAARGHLALYGERDALVSLTFHAVLPDSASADRNLIDPSNQITREDLRFLIEHYLGHGYRFVSPDDLRHGLLEPGRYAQLTFDDGYCNNLGVLPILDEFEIPATFFITSANVEQGRSYWWDVLYRATVGRRRPASEFRRRVRELVWQPVEATEAALLEAYGEAAFRPIGDIDRPLTPRELVDLAKHPRIWIGNHTKGHAVLTHYDEAGIRDQITACQDFLARLIGSPPDLIAYPCGQYNDLVLRVVSELGFSLGFSTGEAKTPIPIDPGGALTLGRFGLGSARTMLGHCLSHRSEIHGLLSRVERRLERFTEV